MLSGAGAPATALKTQGSQVSRLESGLGCSSVGRSLAANTYLIPHVHADRGLLTQLLQTLPGLCKMAEKLPESLSGTESVLQPGAVIQLERDANLERTAD